MSVALKRGLLAFLSFVGMINSSNANEVQNYAGFQYSLVTYEDTSLGNTFEFEPTALVVRMGTVINRYFSLEGRIGTGFSDDSATRSGTTPITFEYDIKGILGFYALGNLPVSDRFNFYGIAGVTRVTAGVSTESPGANTLFASDTEKGFSYGFGTNIGFGQDTFFNFEYISYLDKDSFTTDAVNAGVLINF